MYHFYLHWIILNGPSVANEFLKVEIFYDVHNGHENNVTMQNILTVLDFLEWVMTWTCSQQVLRFTQVLFPIAIIKIIVSFS